MDVLGITFGLACVCMALRCRSVKFNSIGVFFFFFFCLLCAVSASLCFVEVSLILIISGVAAVLGGMIVEFIFDRLCSCVLLVMIAVVDCSALRFLYGFGSILRAGSICFGLCNFLEGLTLLVFFNGFLGVRWKRV